MAGKVRPSPSYQYLVAQAFYVSALAPNGVPVDETLRLRIHLAIIKRLQNFHPDEYQHCMAAVGLIAKFEAADGTHVTADARAFAIDEQLNLIATAVPSRAPHSKDCIRYQQAIFRDLLTQDHYVKECTASRRLAWFQIHWDQIQAIVSRFPCSCRPRTSLEKFSEFAKIRPDYLVTIANASDFFLAFTHSLRTVSPENLRKCLKTKS